MNSCSLSSDFGVLHMWSLCSHIHEMQLGAMVMSISAAVFKMAGQYGHFHKPTPMYFYWINSKLMRMHQVVGRRNYTLKVYL